VTRIHAYYVNETLLLKAKINASVTNVACSDTRSSR